jgi:hypothetical protein
MRRDRNAVLPALGLIAVVMLTGCSAGPPPTSSEETEPPTGISAQDLDETTWTGVDSGNLETTFTLHSGSTVAVTYNGNAYEIPGDTWNLDGDTLTITIYNVESLGDATYVGDVTDAAGPIDLAVTFSDVTETRTLTITKG